MSQVAIKKVDEGSKKTRKPQHVLVLGVLLLCGAFAVARSKDDPAKRLVGTWKLISFQERLSDGSVRPTQQYGPNPVGQIIYTDMKRMCVVIMTPDLADEQVRGWNCGTYEINVAEKCVVHHVQVADDSNAVEKAFKECYTFAGSRLILRNEPPPKGVLERFGTWEKIEN
jgi:hypothetical protein